jgi:hypothetical protein
MVTASRDEFLRFARLHRLMRDPRPIRVTREIGFAPSLFSHEDGSKPTVVTSSPVVYLTYLTWKEGTSSEKYAAWKDSGREPVIFREMFGGVIATPGTVGAIEIVLEDSLHDWLIANANEMHFGYENVHVRVYPDEPDRELEYVIDHPTTLVQKM